jgi:hypothetical protein
MDRISQTITNSNNAKINYITPHFIFIQCEKWVNNKSYKKYMYILSKKGI